MQPLHRRTSKLQCITFLFFFTYAFVITTWCYDMSSKVLLENPTSSFICIKLLPLVQKSYIMGHRYPVHLDSSRGISEVISQNAYVGCVQELHYTFLAHSQKLQERKIWKMSTRNTCSQQTDSNSG